MVQIDLLHRDWLVAIKTTDSKVAFAALYRQFWQDLFLHALKRVRDEQQAEDLVQELFIRFWEQRAKLDIDMNLPAYLYGILKFKIIDFYHADKVKPQLLAHWAESMQLFVDDNPEQLEAYLYLERLLEAELEKMPRNMKDVILLKWDHLNIKEIAARLQLSEQTVKNNLTEGGKRLQRALLQRDHGKYSALGLLAIQLFEELSR